MKEQIMSLEINQDAIKPVIEKQIHAAIIANIGNPEELIQKVVSLALSQKVNSAGEVDRYSNYNKYDYLEVLATRYIREAADKALREWLAEKSELVKKAVIKELNKPNRQRSMANAFADAVENSLKAKWNMTCNIDFKRD